MSGLAVDHDRLSFVTSLQLFDFLEPRLNLLDWNQPCLFDVAHLILSRRPNVEQERPLLNESVSQDRIMVCKIVGGCGFLFGTGTGEESGNSRQGDQN